MNLARAVVSLALSCVVGCGGAAGPPVVSDPPSRPETTTPETSAPSTTRHPSRADTSSPTVTVSTEASPLRTEEVAASVHSAWLGWYAAVAAGDEALLGDSVALTSIHEDGVAAIASGSLEFTQSPSTDAYELSIIEILRDEPTCLVVALREDPTAFLVDGVAAERIGVFWPHDGTWYLATSWVAGSPEVAWSDDCDLMSRRFA